MIDLTLSNGATMPALGMGTWQLEGAAAVSATSAALRVGYRHIDTAQIYNNEGEVGTAIRQSGIGRSEIFLTTKVWTNRFRAGDLQASVDESLTRLATDYVDLLLLHWMQPKVPLAETIGALNDVVRAGKTRAIGVSNFTVAGMREAVALSAAPIVTNQIEYHALLSRAGTAARQRRAWRDRRGVRKERIAGRVALAGSAVRRCGDPQSIRRKESAREFRDL